MKLLLLKDRLKKAWLWTKHHWYVPLIIMALIIAVLIWALTKNGAFVGALMDILENSRATYKKEIDTLNEIHTRATKEREHILKKYNENIGLLEKEYAEKNQELDEEKKKEVKRLIEESYNDPDVLARELAKLHGFEHG